MLTTPMMILRIITGRIGLVYVLFLILQSSPFQSFAQETGEDELGNWLMYFGTHKLNEKYSIHHEGQLRLYEAASNFNQLLLRYGLNRHVSANAMLTAGYAFISTATFDKEAFEVRTAEHRIWQQLILRNKVGRLSFEHRYRLEQRWISSDDIADDYTNRARYRLFISLPLNKKEMVDGTIFLAFYDEIFLNLNDNPFSQNRFYLALGYKINDSINLQTGYLRNKIGGNEFNRMQFAVFLNTASRDSAE